MSATDRIEDVLAKYITNPTDLRDALAEITGIVRETMDKVFERFEKENA